MSEDVKVKVNHNVGDLESHRRALYNDVLRLEKKKRDLLSEYCGLVKKLREIIDASEEVVRNL